MEVIVYTQSTLGPHIRYEGTLKKTILKAIEYCNYSFQIMFGSPRSYTCKGSTEEDLNESKELLEKHPLNIFIHAPYIFNLAGSKSRNSLAWDGDLETDKLVYLSIKGLEERLQVLSRIQNKRVQTGVVLHCGSWGDGKDEATTKNGLDVVAKSISKISFPKDTFLLIETMVGKGGVLGRTYEEIKYIIDKVVPEKRKYLKVCCDTEHLFANGTFNLKSVQEVERMFIEFIKVFGSISLLGLIHLNDSKVEFGSKIDRHELITCGKIWEEDDSSLLYLMNKATELNIPVILETSPCDYKRVQKLCF